MSTISLPLEEDFDDEDFGDGLGFGPDAYGIVDGRATRWVTRDREALPIASMGDRHLQNALRMLERQLAAMREGDLLPDMMGGLITEIARRAGAQHVDEVEQSCAPILKGLRAELQRRGLPELVP